MCEQEDPPKVAAAAVVDHLVPHKRDPGLFWDRSNCSLCEPHHNHEKQRLERLGYASRGAVGGGRALRVGRAGGQTHLNELRGTRGCHRQQTCGAPSWPALDGRADEGGETHLSQAQVRCNHPRCRDGFVGGIGPCLRQAADGIEAVAPQAMATRTATATSSIRNTRHPMAKRTLRSAFR